MPPSYPRLSAHLDDAGTDGYLVEADGEDSTQYYLSGFDAMSTFVTLYADGEVRLLVPDLAYPRARDQSDADEIRRRSAFDFGRTFDEHGPAKAGPLTTAAFLAGEGVDSVSVPPSFPNGTADVLRHEGIEVVTDYDETVVGIRAVKTDAEVESIAAAQRANEEAFGVVEELFERATVEDGVREGEQREPSERASGDGGPALVLDGEALTSERVRRVIRATLREADCEASECIVAAGAEGARTHAVGSGPIEAGEPVIVDVAPRDEASGYVGDMTRTFVKGEPSAKVSEWYDLTREAFEVALEMVEPGVTGEAVNDAVCDFFERKEYPTLRTDEATQDGFIHTTGHGVGLDLHEQPMLGWGGEELEPGHVVTVEPGLYEQGVGGVRLEDVVVVTEDGYESLNEYPRDLRIA